MNSSGQRPNFNKQFGYIKQKLFFIPVKSGGMNRRELSKIVLAAVAGIAGFGAVKAVRGQEADEEPGEDTTIHYLRAYGMRVGESLPVLLQILP